MDCQSIARRKKHIRLIAEAFHRMATWGETEWRREKQQTTHWTNDAGKSHSVNFIVHTIAIENVH